jgi:hypothetical protein
MVRRTVIALGLALAMFAGTTAGDASAHSYVTGVSCRNATIYGVRHVNVNWGFDRHDAYARSMTYNEWYYYCA